MTEVAAIEGVGRTYLCLNCKSEKFTERVTQIGVDTMAGTKIIKHPAMVCENCGWYTMTDEQADSFIESIKP